MLVGIDPGVRNFAVSVVTSERQVQTVRMVSNTLTNLKTDPRNQLGLFLREVQQLLPKGATVRAERYSNRGVRSISGELINMSLGVLFGITDFELIMPATWKNRADKFFDLNCYYACCAVPPHVVDATMIALYPDLDLTFGDLRDLCKSMEQSYAKTGRLRNIRDRPQRVKALRASIDERRQ